jgi:hypothetical protein
VRAALERVRAMSLLTEGLERRQGERISAGGPVRLQTGAHTATVHLRDISESGLRVSYDPALGLRVGDQAQVEITGSEQVKALAVRVVRIVLSDQGPDQDQDLGLAFDEPSPEVVGFVRRYMASFELQTN